jgi:protein involved in polysaccharide export with SLBB domain
MSSLKNVLLRLSAGAALACIVVPMAHAQLPTPDQAERLLQTRPDLVAQLRQWIANSGMTPDQIRDRLRAAGYPPDMLDQYIGNANGSGASAAAGTSSASGASGLGGASLPGGLAGLIPGFSRDSLSALIPSEDEIDAIEALGISDSSGTAQMREMIRSPRGGLGAGSFADDDTLGGGVRGVVDSPGRPRLVPARGRRRLAFGVDSGATIFGLNLFEGGSTQFDANLSGPVDANYRLGAGDRLVLIITGDAEKAYTLDVTREGFIVVPGIGEVAAANLSLGQLEDVLFPRLARVYSGLRRDASATTHFSLNVARLHTNQIVVAGDVDAPGSYRVSSAGTALTAVYAAGGPTMNGSLRHIEIRRGGTLVDTLDLYDYLLRGDASHDPRLQSGDVVFVPVHGPRARIYGEVTRPATYELRRGETLADLVAAAGGFTAEAARRRVQISRILPPTERDTTDRARVVIEVSSARSAAGTVPPYPLEAGDVVRVFGVNAQVARTVTVRGDVWTPGTIGFTPGMHLSDALRTAGGVKPDVYLGQVLIARLRSSDSTRVELRTAFQDSTGRPTDDIVLDDADQIRVFSVSEFRAPTYVAITGAVRRPGQFAYHEGMTLRDLMLLAGGPEQRAYLREAEIARLPASREGGRLALTERVPLDSTYAIGREHGGRYVASTDPSILPEPTAPEVPLQPYDNVLILAQPDWERTAHVIVAGEVRFPGTYTLESTSDRLSDVLRRAGGLTQAAYPGGIVFDRQPSGVSGSGRIGVDLPRVLRDSTYRDNLLLRDGDSIFLPRYSGVVDVQGAVNAPHGVAYVPGEDLEYYVRAAGGLGEHADNGRAYVTQPDGNVQSVRTRFMRTDVIPVPRAGSVVVVPTAQAAQAIDTDGHLALLAQIVGSLVTLAAVLHH